jgi:hypothetical protein
LASKTDTTQHPWARQQYFRFFGWGSIPIGAAFFGAFVKVSSDHMTKESALTIPFYISAVGCVLILIYITVRLRLDE